MPAVRRAIYLNAGTAGPLPEAALEAMRASALGEWEGGRITPDFHAERLRLREELRGEVARLVGADPDEIALTRSTTDGINIALWGLPWRAGDEVITTGVEHPGLLLPLYVLRQRLGVRLRVVDPGPLGDARRLEPGEGEEAAEGCFFAALEEAWTPRSRLLALSHVSYATGARFPLERLVAWARRHHLWILVDGAQSAGPLPLDLPASGVDLYAFPGQKWLCGPEGTGALYVRRELLGEIEPTFAGYATARRHDATGYFLPQEGARRFEVGTTHGPAEAGWLASLRWLGREVGWDALRARATQLVERAAASLSAIPGLQLLTPPWRAGLLSFVLDGVEPASAVAPLKERGIWLRHIPDPPCLRIAVGFYNTEEEIDRLASELKGL